MINVVNKRHFNGIGTYIGRGSALGNPYSSKPSSYNVIRTNSPEISVKLFEQYLLEELKGGNTLIRNALNDIWKQAKAGRTVNLVCFCKDKHGNGVCHGDVIKKIVESKL